MSPEFNIRRALSSDAASLLAIYAPYVTDTAISFEYDVPTREEFAGRIAAITGKYPYLLAEANGRAVGYAYASCFKPRAAYDRAVEVTVYVDGALRGRGLGRALYGALENALRRQNILNLYACIAHTERTDEYLDNASEAFHAHMGYRKVAHFAECGFKFGRWYDMVWMEKLIGLYTACPEPVIPFSALGPADA